MKVKTSLFQFCFFLFWILLLLLLIPINAPAQIYTQLHSFSAATDFTAPLIAGPDGTLYGASGGGGAANAGTIFKIQSGSTNFSRIHDFNVTNGATPLGGMVLSGNTLYGTTQIGGSSNFGTIFKINTDGTAFATLYNFTGGRDGERPVSTLVLSGSTLYGTSMGSTMGNNLTNFSLYGTIFKMNIDGSSFSLVHQFTNGTNGSQPQGGVIISGGTLYGVTIGGGTGFEGAVFKVNTDGSSFTTVHSFAAAPAATNSDGRFPSAPLILSNNVLYGTTSAGGIFGEGTIFSVHTDGSAFANLHNLGSTENEGDEPVSGLLLSGNVLYGTTQVGGTKDLGTIFSLNSDGTDYSTLRDFGQSGGGLEPVAGLVMVSNLLYGASLSSTVFHMGADGTGFTTIASGLDGFQPSAGLVLAGNVLYGTTRNGGLFGNGSIFTVATDGISYTCLYSFTPPMDGDTNTDGGNPVSQLALSGSTLYGTTTLGGSANFGTVFAIQTDGMGFTNLHNFTGLSDGATPLAGLIVSGNALFGTTSIGGSNPDGGVVFKLNTDGTGFTTLHNFSEFGLKSEGTYSFPNADGGSPMGSLVLSGSLLYGTTFYGGSGGAGTVFAVDTNGMNFTNLYSFSGVPYDGTNPVDGAQSQADLILSSNSLYGTTRSGGKGMGTVFKINTDGTAYFTLHNFTNGFDGREPLGGLISDGNRLFGMAQRFSGDDSVYQVNMDGTGFVTLHEGEDDFAFGALVFSNQTLYGTTFGGGSPVADRGIGTVFSVSLTSVPATAQFTAAPTNGAPPFTVQFTGPGADSYGNLINNGWNWNFGDGSNSVAQNPLHIYPTNGVYHPTLTVTNNDGIVIDATGPAIAVAYPVLVNGGDQFGTLAPNTTNFYTFTVNKGDHTLLRLGSTNFFGELQIAASNGTVDFTTTGTKLFDVESGVTWNIPGIYTVLISSVQPGGAGNYVVRLAQTPERYVVPAGDEGGPLSGAASYRGKISLGDLDMYSFTAFKGDPINIQLNTTNFFGRLELCEPSGALETSTANITNLGVTISGTVPSNGVYTVIVGAEQSGGVGTYGLTVNGLNSGVKISRPAITSTNLTFTGVGSSGGTAILYTSSDLTTPFNLWTPVLTNTLDQTGVINVTNTVDPSRQSHGYFRLVVH